MTPPPISNAMRANSPEARDVANVLHPYTDLRAHLTNGPLVINHGEGVRVWDEAGKGYIDAVAGLWCASLGFSNERLVQAAATQMRKLAELCREKGLRDRIVLIAGGTQVNREMAAETGLDATFGRGTKGIQVVDAMVKTLRQRGAL